ncbi:MAG: hypothetical protein ACSHXL_02895 [Bacteroidota bacterium]
MKSIISFLFLGLILSSCIEIIDDISMNADGSGTFKYNINLSASKVKINSVLALDSLEGKKIPSRDEIKGRINHFVYSLEQKNGISNVFIESDMDNYIVKLTCDFKSVKILQDAITETLQEELKDNPSILNDNSDWLKWTGDSFTRSIPDFTIKKTKELKEEEINLLKQGNYICISRFNRPVKECSNANALIAKNNLAVMLKTNAYSLTQNLSLLENTIYLSPLKP